MKNPILFVILAGLFLNSNGIGAQTSLTAYEFGVLPYLTPARLEKAYTPAVLEFSRLLHRRVYLRTSTKSQRFFDKLQEHAFDIAIVNPFDSVAALGTFGYVPIASRPSHRCNIYANVSGPITRIDDLKHKVVGVASERSPITFFSLRILNRHNLRAGTDYLLKTYPTTPACLHNLVVGQVDACGASSVTADVFKTQRGIDLRVVENCEMFPGMVVIVHSRVPQSDRELLRQAILSWPYTEEGRTLLSAIGKHARFVPYDAQAYKNIKTYYQEWMQLESIVP